MLSIGAGYFLGYFLVSLLLVIYDFLNILFSINQFIALELLALLFFLFFRKKQANETVKEKSNGSVSSNVVYLLSSVVIILMLYRWGLTLLDLLSKPLFPWDGWLSWTAKAKLIFFYNEIPEFYGGTLPFWELDNSKKVFVSGGSRHPYFVSLIQVYSALAWGGWDDNIVVIPWLGLSIAVVLLTVGGLRYLGYGLLPAILSAYMIISMPIFDTHVSLGAYADVWVGGGLLICIFLLAIFLVDHEKSIIGLLVMFLLMVLLTKQSAFIAITILLLAFSYDFLGKILYIFIIFTFLIVYGLDHYRLISPDYVTFNPVVLRIFKQWLVLDNFHYLLVICFISLCLIILKHVQTYRQFERLLLRAGLFSLFSILVIALFTTKMADFKFTGYFNRISLYFFPTLSLLPAVIYSVITNIKKS